MWKHNDFIKRRENLPWQVMEGSTLVLNPITSLAHEFKGTAGFIWNKLDKGIVFSHLLEEICNKYEIDREDAEVDLKVFLNQLRDKELLS